MLLQLVICFNKGIINHEVIVALAGSEVLKPRYFRTIRGGCIKKMVESNVVTTNFGISQVMCLPVLHVRPDNYLNYYDSMVTVIPEGNYSEFLGWALPGFG
jgi:Na+-transporting NADH:ubiquinone oxidoreductase subunit A